MVGLFQIGIIIMPVGDIVFAPLKDGMWPGRVIEQTEKGVMTWIKFFKVKNNFQVPTNTLLAFDEVNIATFLRENPEKTYALAVKTAQNEVKKGEKWVKNEDSKMIQRIKEEMRREVKAEEEDVIVKDEEDEVIKVETKQFP